MRCCFIAGVVIESVSCYRGNPFAVLPEGQGCLRGLDDVLDLLHAHKNMIHFSVACWIPYYIFLLRFKDPILKPNGRRADVLRGHGCKPCRLIMYLVIF